MTTNQRRIELPRSKSEQQLSKFTHTRLLDLYFREKSLELTMYKLQFPIAPIL